MQHSHTELEYTTNRNFFLNSKVGYMVFECLTFSFKKVTFGVYRKLE